MAAMSAERSSEAGSSSFGCCSWQRRSCSSSGRLIDAIKNPNLSDTERIVWIIVIIFVGCLGPILYLLIGRNKTPRGPTGTNTGI